MKGIHILLPVGGVHFLGEGRIEAETLGDRVDFPNDLVLRRPNLGGVSNSSGMCSSGISSTGSKCL